MAAESFAKSTTPTTWNHSSTASGEVVVVTTSLALSSSFKIILSSELKLVRFTREELVGVPLLLMETEMNWSLTSMTSSWIHPESVTADALVAEAQKRMKAHMIDELPVVDDDGRPVGLLDIQELLEVGFAL